MADEATTDMAAVENEVFTKHSHPQMISIARVRKSEVALREPQRQDPKYKLLVDSIAKFGVLQGILVREQKDPETGAIFYGLVDGLQRFSAACDAGLDTIPANVVNLTDAEVLETQLITNLNRLETKPADQSKHLLRMLARNPLMTKLDLAGRVCQSLGWVEERLGLQKLKQEIQDLVDEGRIHLTNAYSLSKLPQDEQDQHVEAALTEAPKTFVPRMKERLKAIRDANKSGGDVAKAGFTPVQFMQKVSDIKKEAVEGVILRTLIAKHNVTDPLEAAKLALNWAMHFDPDSQAEQQRDYDVKQAQREEKKKTDAAERERLKKEKAAEAAASISHGL